MQIVSPSSFVRAQGSSKETHAQLAKPVAGGQERVFVGACLGWEQGCHGKWRGKIEPTMIFWREGKLGKLGKQFGRHMQITKSGIVWQEAHAHAHDPHPEDDTTMRPGLFVGALFLQGLYNDAM